MHIFPIIEATRLLCVQAAWEIDLERYLQDEDDDSFAVTTRVAAQQLIIELLDSTGTRWWIYIYRKIDGQIDR